MVIPFINKQPSECGGADGALYELALAVATVQ